MKISGFTEFSFVAQLNGEQFIFADVTYEVCLGLMKYLEFVAYLPIR